MSRYHQSSAPATGCAVFLGVCFGIIAALALIVAFGVLAYERKQEAVRDYNERYSTNQSK